VSKLYDVGKAACENPCREMMSAVNEIRIFFMFDF